LFSPLPLPIVSIYFNFPSSGKRAGEWALVDKCVGLSLVNRFDPNQVRKCSVHWGTGDLNMELWSEERPVSKDTPLRICHQYEVRQTA
jgi:hypothetical protein